MTSIDPKIVIRAWRDPAFAANLPEAVRRALPPSPAGSSTGSLGEQVRDRLGPQGTVASTCNTVASVCNTVAASCNTVSSDCNTVSANCNTVSSDCNTVSAKCNTVASDCGTRRECTFTAACRG